MNTLSLLDAHLANTCVSYTDSIVEIHFDDTRLTITLSDEESMRSFLDEYADEVEDYAHVHTTLNNEIIVTLI